MCVQVCPAGAWGVCIHSLCHRAFIEHLLCVQPTLDMGVKEKWSLGKGKTDVEEALLVPEVGMVGNDWGAAGKVWQQAKCEPPQDPGGCHLLGVLGLSPFYGCGNKPGEVTVTHPGSPRQPVMEVGPGLGCLTAEHLLSPVPPPAWGSTARCSHHLGGLGDLNPRHPDSAARWGPLFPSWTALPPALSPHPAGPSQGGAPCIPLCCVCPAGSSDLRGASKGLTTVPASGRGSLRPGP